MKKKIALILCIAMLASACCIPASAAAGSMDNFVITNPYTDGTFTDVHPDDWFAEGVGYSYGYTLMIGQTETTFGPLANITIGEVVALASRMHYIYYGMNMDLSGGNPWYKPYVNYAVNNDIIEKTDYPDYTLDATREQMAKIIYKALPSEALPVINDIKAGEIPDVGSGAASDYIYALYRAGVISGRNGAGRFYPRESIMRGECASIVARMVNTSLRKTFVLDASKDVISANPNLGPVDGSGNIATVENLTTMVNDCRQAMFAGAKAAEQAYTYYHFPLLGDPRAVVLKLLQESVNCCEAGATKAKEAALFCKDNDAYSAAYAPLYNVYNLGSSYDDCVAVVVADILGHLKSTGKEKTAHWSQVLQMADLMQENATKAYNIITSAQK